MVYIGSLEYDGQLKKSEGIIIFGGGCMLPYLLQKLKYLDLDKKIMAICDNNVNLQGKEISGIPVLSPDYACKKFKEFDFIVYNQYFMEICEQLQKIHSIRIHLIRQGTL